eukprot:119595-Rhodomonas_salina.1
MDVRIWTPCPNLLGSLRSAAEILRVRGDAAVYGGSAAVYGGDDAIYGSNAAIFRSCGAISGGKSRNFGDSACTFFNPSTAGGLLGKRTCLCEIKFEKPLAPYSLYQE